MDTDRVLALSDQIRQKAVQTASDPIQSRSRLLQLIDELRLVVKTPTKTVLRLIYQNAALRTVLDLGIFELLVDNANKEGISATSIASCTGADRNLIIRLMRVITSLGLCTNVRPEIYCASDKTVAMEQPIGKHGVPCIYDLTVPTLTKLPQFLREHNYINPEEDAKSPMQWTTGHSQFEWLAKNKHHQDLFNSYMSSRREEQLNWFNVYPLERLITGAKSHPDSVFLVDIGGNQGHDLSALRANCPKIPGRLILQDLPQIMANVDRREIEVMDHSFFGPPAYQKDARIYYFRAIFHLGPDRICQKILMNTVSAMNPVYSRIIIVDFVLPDINVPRMQAAMDIQMMSIGAGVERSKRQWTELLASVGLKIAETWTTSPGMESIIEVVPLFNGGALG